MGFWHTGYMEFHEPSGEGTLRSLPPPPPVYPCKACGVAFKSRRDFEVHLFKGHSLRRPTLVFRGREVTSARVVYGSR